MSQSIVETSAYLAAAKDVGMSADEQQAVVDLIAANPEAGDVMPGCGGARKLRGPAAANPVGIGSLPIVQAPVYRGSDYRVRKERKGQPYQGRA